MPENMSISVNGQSQVPPGFRFHPTEEELLQYYLRKKVSYEKIDLDVIRDVDLNKLEPWDIQGVTFITLSYMCKRIKTSLHWCLAHALLCCFITHSFLFLVFKGDWSLLLLNSARFLWLLLFLRLTWGVMIGGNIQYCIMSHA